MSRPRTEPRDRVATSVRFRPELFAALKAFCDERELSVNWVTNRAVERYLAQQAPAFPPPGAAMTAATNPLPLTSQEPAA